MAKYYTILWKRFEDDNWRVLGDAIEDDLKWFKICVFDTHQKASEKMDQLGEPHVQVIEVEDG